ncbi:PREDICTED: uncharacterized protein LOC106816971 [Priapulus caudatus]|uniref:Uncharacterized protein LOC106816971 n=1 Tax=Priapulus caudatus TaxID=37621 RepID=A0ABM1EY31_PRICU|nr:PREDICTED: uncharacterized protein LOC106816971 [Priapulus caudatus]
MANHIKNIRRRSSMFKPVIQAETDYSYVFLFDRRKGNEPEKHISLEGLSSFNLFKEKVEKVFGLKANEQFVIATTERAEVNDDESYGQHVGRRRDAVLLRSAPGQAAGWLLD